MSLDADFGYDCDPGKFSSRLAILSFRIKKEFVIEAMPIILYSRSFLNFLLQLSSHGIIILNDSAKNSIVHDY
jgi:hypothetical protein